MYAQFGNTQFENLKTPSSISLQEATTYAQYDLINSKPVIEKTANELIKLSMNIGLRQDFCNVKEERDKLYTAMRNGTDNVLLMGDGSVIGRFIITDISETWRYTDPVTGALISVVLSVNFLEFVIRDKLQTEKNKAVQNSINKQVSKSSGSKTAQKPKKPYDGWCDKNISSIYSSMNANYAAIGELIPKILTTDLNYAKAFQLCNQLLTQASGLTQLGNNYPCVKDNNLGFYAQNIVDATDSVRKTLSSHTVAQTNYDSLLTPAMRVLRGVLLPNIQNAATGRVG